MSSQRVCPNCKQDVEDGAIYCGNCGYKMVDQPTPTQQVYSNGPAVDTGTLPSTPIAQGANVPSYAVPHSHHKKHWAAIALAFGILGMGAGAIVPVLGIAFGIIGIILVTSSYHLSIKWLRIAGLIASILAILVGLGIWVNAIVHNPKLNQTSQASGSNSVSTINLTTPCYTLSFNSELNVNNSSGSCSMNAYNGSSFNDSSDVFKVVANQVSGLNDTNFASISKQSIEKDIATNLQGFSITGESSGIFSGSPAYYVQAYNSSDNVAVIEEGILHIGSSTSKDDYFVIIHALNGHSVNLDGLAASWTWNN